jgi:hypothetical protein
MGKRETQIILKTDERSIHLELGREGQFNRKSIGWGENRVSSRAISSRSRSRTGAGCQSAVITVPRSLQAAAL